MISRNLEGFTISCLKRLAQGQEECIQAAQEKKRYFYNFKDTSFAISEPIDGNPATVANGGTIGFNVDSTEQGDAWHKAGIENGGISIEEPPGIRDYGKFKMYLAYQRDPTGHKLCALLLIK